MLSLCSTAFTLLKKVKEDSDFLEEIFFFILNKF